MKNRRKPALAIRLYVDGHGLTFWELYERATSTTLLRIRTSRSALRRAFDFVREVTI